MKKFILSAIAMFSLQVMAEFIVPATPHPVNDYAGVLSEKDKNMIAHVLVQLKEDTGAQGGVLIVDSLDGTAIEDASIKVAEAWKLGAGNADSGVLLMLAIKDHKSRLEIGRGLEGILTDADSKEILFGMRGDLRAGNYGLAINDAINSVSSKIVAYKQDIMVKPKAAEVEPGVGLSLFFLIIGFGGLFAMLIYFIRKGMKTEKKDVAVGIPERPYKPYVRRDLDHKRSTSKSTVRASGESTKEKRSGGDTTIIAPVIVSNHTDYGGYSSDSGSSSYSSNDSSFSSDNSSSWSGGGGDFSGGGSSDSW